MATVDAAVAAVHLLVAGVWTGSVVFVAGAVRPVAATGDLNAAPLLRFAGRLRWLSRGATLLLLATGGYMTLRWYGVAELTGTAAGQAVVAMLVLWFVMAGLVEMGAGRLASGADARKVRQPARAARTPLAGAAVVGCGLLLLGGWLAYA